MARNEKEKEQAKEGREEEEKDECCICLGEIGEVMGCLTCCEHKFCFACISQWAEKSNTCPLCKQRFREIIRKTVRCPPFKFSLQMCSSFCSLRVMPNTLFTFLNIFLNTTQ